MMRFDHLKNSGKFGEFRELVVASIAGVRVFIHDECDFTPSNAANLKIEFMMKTALRKNLIRYRWHVRRYLEQLTILVFKHF